jgi:predicted nucleotidyltransferase
MKGLGFGEVLCTHRKKRVEFYPTKRISLIKQVVSIMDEEKLTREVIVKTLVNALKPLDYVHAFYEGGAAAFNRIDEWSDVDLYIVVDDEKVDATFLAAEKTLESLSPIEHKLKTPQLPWSGVFQTFYKLENASEFLLIDLAVLKLSASEKFLEPITHGNVVFYFNKNDALKPMSFDKEAFLKKLHERLEMLQARFSMFNSLVQKEINRGNYLEAIEWYHVFTLAPLVEALRIKHNPIHHDFRMRYVHYELPPEITSKLENLYFIKNPKDLQEKYHKATKWFQETISKINPSLWSPK